jgi:integrase
MVSAVHLGAATVEVHANLKPGAALYAPRPHVRERRQRGDVPWWRCHRAALSATAQLSEVADGTECIRAERTPHDFRRSCARNLIRAGIHQTVARQITGHRTESMYTRYNITAEADLTDATERLDEYLKQEASRLPSGHNLGTIAVAGRRKASSSPASS